MSTKIVQDSSAEIDLVSQMYKNCRSWAIVTLVLGGVSLIGRETFDPGWGIILIITSILSWKTRIPGMFALYAVIMGWAAITNLVVGLSGGEWWWFVLALAQTFWTVSLIKQLRKYRSLRITELYQAGDWPANLSPPQNEEGKSRNFAFASVIMAASPWILLPVFCLAITIYVLAYQSSQPPEIVMQSFDQLAFANLTQFLCSGTIAMPVLALGLGIAALVSKTSKKKLALGGVITSAIFLIIFLILALIGLIFPF